MTTVTIDVPDELAKQLEGNSDRIVDILRFGLLAVSEPDNLAPLDLQTEIANLKAPQAMQERIAELLDKSRQGELTAREGVELDQYTQLDYVMTLMKVKAVSYLQTGW